MPLARRIDAALSDRPILERTILPVQTPSFSPQSWAHLKGVVADFFKSSAEDTSPKFAKAFWLLVREVHAKAISMLFAFAKSLLERLEKKLAAPKRFGRKPPKGKGRTVSAWRNPQAIEVEWLLLEEPKPVRPPPRHREIRPEPAYLTKSLALLNALAALCEKPERFARRLAKAILRHKVTLAKAEVRAFSIARWAQFRRDRKVAKLLRRPFRRRDSG